MGIPPRQILFKRREKKDQFRALLGGDKTDVKVKEEEKQHTSSVIQIKN